MTISPWLLEAFVHAALLVCAVVPFILLILFFKDRSKGDIW